MLESVRLTAKVIEVGSLEALPKFPDTSTFYYVNTAQSSWWRWHDGDWYEYEPSMFPGQPHLLPKCTAKVMDDRLPKCGRIGVLYQLHDGNSFLWNRDTASFIQINASSTEPYNPTVTVTLDRPIANTHHYTRMDVMKVLFKRWWLEEIDDAHYFNEMAKLLGTTSEELGLVPD